MVTFGITILAVVLGISIVVYLLYTRHRQIAAGAKIAELHVKRDTARILEEYKREQVEIQWEEYDKQQWERRFHEEEVHRDNI